MSYNSIPAFEEKVTLEKKGRRPLEEQELKAGDPSFAFDSNIYVQGNAQAQKIDTTETNNRTNFNQNLRYWNQETGFMSVNNFDNAYFQEIVNMGTDAVPFIIEELKKGPTQLVHALDLIFPGAIEYQGSVTLEEACEAWLEALE